MITTVDIGDTVWYSVPSDHGSRRYRAKARVKKTTNHGYCYIDILDGWLAGRTVYAFRDELARRDADASEAAPVARKRGRPRKQPQAVG